MKLFAVFLSVSTLLILPQVSFSQRSGNQVYGNNNYYNNNTISSLESVYSTDTSLVISSKILLNKAPDLLVVSLGIQEEGKTVKICNEAITARINKLFENLKSIEIKKEDFYVDFISQAKLYDFETAQNKIEQFEKGFEIKKNIIIRLNKPSDFDKLIELCAEQEIYDIIKADYINTEVEKIYSEMYNEGVKIVEWKKKRYLQNSNQTMLSSSRIKKDQFYSIYPKTQYKQYEAVESTDVKVYTNKSTGNFLKKEARKKKTFYYEGTSLSGFDKIINGDTPVVGIQYILELSIEYDAEKK